MSSMPDVPPGSATTRVRAPQSTQRSSLALAGALLLVGLATSLGILWLLSELHEELVDPWTRYFDSTATTFIHSWTSPALTLFMRGVTALGSVPAITLLTVIGGAVLYLLGHRIEAVALVTASGGAGLLDFVLKLIFQRARPQVPWALASESSFSFPSGHAMLSFALYGIAAFLIWRAHPRVWTALLTVVSWIALVIGIGVSRVYLGVHYPSDVVAGYVASAPWLAFVILTMQVLRRYFAQNDVDSATAYRSQLG